MLRTHNRYSYVLEHLIQAGRNDIPVMSIPIRVNRDLRPSRLIRSMPDYLWRSGTTIIRIFAINRPLRFFAAISAALVLPGVALGVRFLVYYIGGSGAGHVQSLILTALLILAGVLAASVGLLADLMAANRRILEQIEQRARLRALMEPATSELLFSGELIGHPGTDGSLPPPIDDPARPELARRGRS